MYRQPRPGSWRNTPRPRLQFERAPLRTKSVSFNLIRETERNKRDFNHDFHDEDFYARGYNRFDDTQLQTREFINTNYRGRDIEMIHPPKNGNKSRFHTGGGHESSELRYVSASHLAGQDRHAEDTVSPRVSRNKRKRDRAKQKRMALAANRQSEFQTDYVSRNNQEGFTEHYRFTPQRGYDSVSEYNYSDGRRFSAPNYSTREYEENDFRPPPWRSVSLPNLGRINPLHFRHFTHTPGTMASRGTNSNFRSRKIHWGEENAQRTHTKPTRNFSPTNRTTLRQSQPSVVYAPAPPQLKATTKLMYELIRAVHHLDKITTKKRDENTPITFQRLTDLLVATIKPAHPNPRVETLLEGNARNWCYNAQLILEQHYEDLIGNTIQGLKNQTSEVDWPRAFEIATNWAEKNYGDRLTLETIEQAEALYTAEIAERPRVVTPAVTETRQAEQPPPSPRRTYAQVVASPPNQPPPPHITARPQLVTAEVHVQTSPGQRDASWVTGSPDRGDWHVTTEEEAPPLVQPPKTVTQGVVLTEKVRPIKVSLSVPPKKINPCVYEGELSPLISLDQPTQVGPQCETEVVRPTQVSLSVPLEQRIPRDPRPSLAPGRVGAELEEVDHPGSEGMVPTTPSVLRQTSTPPSPPSPILHDLEDLDSSPKSFSGNSPISNLQFFESDNINDNTKILSPLSRFLLEHEDPSVPTPGAPLLSPSVSEGTCAQILVPPSPIPQMAPDPNDIELITSSPSSGGRPKRHANTTRKNIDWRLTIHKKYVILGDSNAARFPKFQNTNLQIDAFPGAKFQHATNLIQGAQITEVPEKIILSFGLNNRQQRLKIRAIKELQNLIKATRDKFPNADILIPVINFSRALSLVEQQMVEAINAYIRKNCDFIPPLPSIYFAVEPDGIHWRPATAKAILLYWAKSLNLSLF